MQQRSYPLIPLKERLEAHVRMKMKRKIRKLFPELHSMLLKLDRRELEALSKSLNIKD